MYIYGKIDKDTGKPEIAFVKGHYFDGPSDTEFTDMELIEYSLTSLEDSVISQQPYCKNISAHMVENIDYYMTVNGWLRLKEEPFYLRGTWDELTIAAFMMRELVEAWDVGDDIEDYIEENEEDLSVMLRVQGISAADAILSIKEDLSKINEIFDGANDVNNTNDAAEEIDYDTPNKDDGFIYIQTSGESPRVAIVRPWYRGSPDPYLIHVHTNETILLSCDDFNLACFNGPVKYKKPRELAGIHHDLLENNWVMVGKYPLPCLYVEEQELLIAATILKKIKSKCKAEEYISSIAQACKYHDTYLENHSYIICHTTQEVYWKYVKAQLVLNENCSKTLAKEDTVMEKTNVIVGVVALPDQKQQITKIVVNKNDRCVVVGFKDGKTENVKCSPEDEFDPYVGVAIAKARHEYGTTGAFHRAVDKIALVVEPKVKKVKVGPIAPGQQPTKKSKGKKAKKGSK